MCLLITTNTRQLGTATAAAAAAAASCCSQRHGCWLEKARYLLPTSWLYETFMPVLSDVSLRIRCTSYCIDGGSYGNLNIYYIIYIYSNESVNCSHIRNFHLLMFRPSSLSLKPVALSLRQIRPTPRAIYHLRMSSTSATDMTPRLSNVLAKSKSPYLLQHKDNPVAVGSFRFLREVLRLTK